MSGAAAGDHRHAPIRLLRLLLLGGMVGLACWPLNAIDHLQDRLLTLLPAWTGTGWSLAGLLLAVAPTAAMPLLLLLQSGPLREATGSGIPQTIESLEHPDRTADLLGWRTTLARLLGWIGASLALMPLGREGPLVQLGSAVARGVQERWPRLLPQLDRRTLVAIGAGAGLAGGFNSPLMGSVFVLEELVGRYQAGLLWPTALVCAAAALVSNLAGMPLYDLGVLSTTEPEWLQLFWGVLIGAGAGGLGGLMAWLLLRAGRILQQPLRRRPLTWGLGLGGCLTLMILLSGGWSGGDGEALMRQLLSDAPVQLPVPSTEAQAWSGILRWLLVLVCRLIGPVLALAAEVPGGLIDPAFGLGSLVGYGLMELGGGNPELGLALGMAGGLAGSTQLPLMTVLFALRMVGDQQWLLGVLVSAVVGATVGRWIQPRPIYRALLDQQQQR
ncbi:chloride channel protein [Synechococcus sp. GFB01]|uniref:chloride channel protein n=1 Tax=Synechococcus sp. GFB01 TaxID=1662190 RepID=UPI00064EF25F|nr:chloride channel protein [Synechococcus sp. GFB01]KMM17032.1 chloride channel protein [Synechococcus sp. GFB01]